jgi:hypothetical protein
MTITDNQQLTQRNANLDLPPLFAEWISSWDLEEILAPILRSTVVWLKRVSPPNASLDNLAVACMDLAWFFYLDDCLKENYNIVFEKCSKILDGYQPASDEAKLFRSYADLIDRIAQRGYDIQHYLQQRKDYLRCRVQLAKQRLLGSTSENKISFNEHFETRQITIGMSVWTSLWEILGDFYLSPSERTMPEVERGVRTVSSAYLLHNDLRSLVRDIEEKAPNLVILYMEQYGGDIVSSIQYLQHLFQQEVNTFRDLFASVINAAPSDRLRQYFEFLEWNLNYITVPNLMEKDLPERYSSNLELAVIAYNQAKEKL